jgi:ATP/maltotriose-dependent transcriptional regulator MalT/DNA-binding SARP family transcriptional activator
VLQSGEVQQPVFLQTKLHPTQVQSRSVQRSRLLEELTRTPSSRVVLITAPAGSGKSTLVTEFVGSRPRRSAWLSLGEEDRDPGIFFSYFLESLCQTYKGCCEETRNKAPQLLQQGAAALCASLINELFFYHEPVIAVLDDYHLVDSEPTIAEFFQLFCRRGPANVQLVIASRDLPDLPIAWLRSKRLLSEIHQDQLRFTRQETDALFREVWKVELDSELLTQLMERTEGWATGLQLVAQTIANKSIEEARLIVGRLATQDDSIYSYLALEVFSQQSPEIQAFLQLTAVPDYFSPELASYLQPEANVESILAYLLRSRLFLISVDKSGEWYRYHHLFRDFLRNSLVRTQSPRESRQLQLKVADWLASRDEMVLAIPHYLAAGDNEISAQKLERVGSELLHRGYRGSLKRWLDSLPPKVCQTRPGLVVLQGELSDLEGNWPKAVENFRKGLAEYREQRDQIAIAATLEKLSLCLIKYGEFKLLLETCEEGLELCPPGPSAVRSMLECWLGSTLINQGSDWQRGYDLIRSGHQGAVERTDPRALSWAFLTYGFGYHFPRGNFTEAIRVLNEGLDYFTRLDWPLVIYQLSMNKALILTIQGQISAAHSVIDETLIQARRAGYTYVEKGLELLRAMAYLESGNQKACGDHLSTCSQSEIPAQFKPYFYRTRLLYHLKEGNLEQAKVDADEMERALAINGAGLYSLECSLASSLLSLEIQDLSAARLKLSHNLQLCQKADAKFWEMKSRQFLAWHHHLMGQWEVAAKEAEASLNIAAPNGYDDYWQSDPYHMSVPLLLLACLENSDANYAERLLARMPEKCLACLQEMVKSEDADIRQRALRFLEGRPHDPYRQLLKQISRGDSDPSMQKAAEAILSAQKVGPRVELYALGPLRVVVDGEELDLARLLRPAGVKLLKFLIVHGSRLVPYDRIYDTFWPEIDVEKARHNLATQISNIRRHLGVYGLVQRVGEGYRLALGEEVKLDTEEFERYVEAALGLARGAQREQAIPILEKVVNLYRSDFLADDLYEDWLETRRRDLYIRYLECLELLADLLMERRLYSQAQIYYRRLLALEEPQEQAFPKLFHCLEQLGDRHAIRRDYELLKSRLQESLGVEPQDANRALIESLHLAN